MAFSFTCNSLNFTFDAYDIFNPSPTAEDGSIMWNSSGAFVNPFNSACSKFNVKAYADSLTAQYGSTGHSEEKVLWIVNAKEIYKDSIWEHAYQDDRFERITILFDTFTGSGDPYTRVRFRYDRSNTANPFNPISVYTLYSEPKNFHPNDVLFNEGAGELIMAFVHPWVDYEGQPEYYKYCGFGIQYNILQLKKQSASGMIPVPEFPDYVTYEDSYSIEAVNSVNLAVNKCHNVNPDADYTYGGYTLVDIEHFIAGLQSVVDNGGDPGGSVTYTPDDPDDDTSDGGGGGDDGDYSQSDGGDEIDFSEDPGLDGLSTGFVKVYAPDTTQMQALSNYMLSTAFIDNVKKLYANPMDYILGLKILPFKPGVSGSEEVTVGGVGTNVYMSKVSSRWKNIDCGSVNVIERFGGYMDYAPYTKIAIYLPFIGVKELNTDEVTGTRGNVGKVTVKYKVDVVTGECIAEVKCKNKKGLNAVCYAFNGNCATDIPITQRDTSKILSGFVGGVSAAAVTGISAMSGNVAGMVGGSIAGLTSIMQSKPTYAHSGNFSGSSGFLGRYKPFLIIESPIQSLSSNFVTQRGYPSNVGKTIGEFDGFTSFNSVRLHDIYSFTLDVHGNKTISSAATQDEIDEIREILKEGVYL